MALDDDLKRYEYAASANRISQSEEGQQFILPTLEKLRGRLNEDAALSTGIAIKHGGIEDIINAYTGKYQKILTSANIGEYLEVEGVNLETAKDNFGEFFNEKYETINGKIEEAKDILEVGGYKFPDEEKERARGNIKKYGGIYLLIKSLESRKFEKLRGEVAGESYDKSVDEIIKDPQKYVAEVFAKYLNADYGQPKEESYNQEV